METRRRRVRKGFNPIGKGRVQGTPVFALSHDVELKVSPFTNIIFYRPVLIIYSS